MNASAWLLSQRANFTIICLEWLWASGTVSSSTVASSGFSAPSSWARRDGARQPPAVLCLVRKRVLTDPHADVAQAGGLPSGAPFSIACIVPNQQQWDSGWPTSLAWLAQAHLLIDAVGAAYEASQRNQIACEKFSIARSAWPH